MLIVPVSGKIGWKHTPLVTLGLILINCLVFFLFQLHDDQSWMAAEQFYLDSGLAEIEVPRYIDYLETKGRTAEKYSNEEEMDAEQLMEIHFQLEDDLTFLNKMAQGRIFTAKEPQYEKWRTLRHSYEEKRNQSVAFSHGLRPAYSRAGTFLTYMFLHGNTGHLLGNMVFLWILGCMLEIGSGRILFTILYLASGLAAGLFFDTVYAASTTPLVGASGAISGLMGAYTVLYGKKRVNVFYSLGFYFNTARIPAVALLPVWLANEGYQLFFGGASHVAYVAHIGGIVAGAGLAVAGKRWVKSVDENRFDEAPEDKVSPLMHKALEHMGNLEMRPAQTLFEEILLIAPDNATALAHLFNIHKLNPDSQEFHAITRRRLGVLLRNAENYPAAIECYETYAGLVRRPALSIPEFLQIAGVMSAKGKPEAAEKIVLAIFKQKPETPGLPSTLIKLAQAFQKIGAADQSQRYRRLICQRFPDSVEAAIILRSQPESS